MIFLIYVFDGMIYSQIEWLASVSGWKEFSLGGDDEEIEEEKVFVPGTALPALVELLLSLCKLIDMATSLTPNVGLVEQLI